MIIGILFTFNFKSFFIEGVDTEVGDIFVTAIIAPVCLAVCSG